ncbi:hypothetical protein [Pseudomonas fragi]|uniref:Uncharacterized protein n=1 Tax=Pseudomonas fragi TaxID=296 RepID=A0A9Q5FRI0_PSEFR|nr:hypothetical protein [Pseudomonas fragi]NNB26701.1 hypothetical protein [Pseudomonas fragi]NNB52461.1 hypothetical protein [Pseudomonas fragi]
MKDQRLLASAALFRQLHDNKKDVYDVLGQFIKSSINISSLWSFNVTQCAISLEKDFGFKVPEAVVKTCLRNRLKRAGDLSLLAGTYSVTQQFERSDTLGVAYREIKDEQDFIRLKLIDHVEVCAGEKLTSQKRDTLASDFYAYFTGGLKGCDNSVYISQFIVKNSNDHEFTRKLNSVEEGLIIYSGICHSSDLANHDPWRNNFTIFLDTEVLFGAVGLNGDLHQNMFREFKGLVKEVNERTLNGAKVELKFFDEAKREIEDFFYAAEMMVQDRRLPDPSKQAMIAIINGCNSAADVLMKKAAFFDALRNLKVNREVECDYYTDPSYNVESLHAIQSVKNENPEFDEDKVASALRLFTKINYLRNGVSDRGLEQSGAILLTGKNITKTVAFNLAANSKLKQTPFASDIDYMTERLWFKLNKGFGGDSKLPTSFDVVARAQVILSTQAGNKVSEEYKLLRSEVDAGRMSMESAGYLVSELRSRIVKPEDFIPESVDETVSFMHTDFIEDSLRNKALLERKVQEGEGREAEILILSGLLAKEEAEKKALSDSFAAQQKFSENSRREDIRKQELRFRRLSYVDARKQSESEYRNFLLVIYLVAVGLAALLIFIGITPSDTLLGVSSLIAGVLSLAIPVFSSKKLCSLISRRVRRNYRSRISEKNRYLPLTFRTVELSS